MGESRGHRASGSGRRGAADTGTRERGRAAVAWHGRARGSRGPAEPCALGRKKREGKEEEKGKGEKKMEKEKRKEKKEGERRKRKREGAGFAAPTAAGRARAPVARDVRDEAKRETGQRKI